MSIFVKFIVITCSVVVWDGPSVRAKGSLFALHAERACIHASGDSGVVSVVVVFVSHVDPVWPAGEKATGVGVCMICDDGFKDGVVEEIPSWIRESGNDRRVPLRGEEGELGGEVLLDDGTRVLCKVRGDCFALMDKCVLDGGNRRLRYIFEMARWR